MLTRKLIKDEQSIHTKAKIALQSSAGNALSEATRAAIVDLWFVDKSKADQSGAEKASTALADAIAEAESRTKTGEDN